MAAGRPQLIGLDWGTTSLRAYLFSASGTILARKTAAHGVMAVPAGDFAAAYHAAVGDWHREHPGLLTIAAGMIGSTQGWVPVPYCACPAGPRELAAAVTVVKANAEVSVHIVPGVRLPGAAPDMMRGEETQVVGALALHPQRARETATFVLPGTHAKWVDVREGRIVRFATYLTGELYALLCEHSILGRPARTAPGREITPPGSLGAAFDRGVLTARDAGPRGLAPLLFRCRALVLEGLLEPQASLDFLSGLLIGDEVRSALETPPPRLALIGEPALCERYRRAFALYGVSDVPIIDGAAPAGLWEIACAIGLSRPAVSHA